MNKQSQFIQHVKDTGLKNNIPVHLLNQPQVVTNGVSCSGYFSEVEGLYVATQKPQMEWFEILAHEFNHMKQYLENAKVWTDINLVGQEETKIGQFDKWLGRELELSPEELDSCISAIINLELDCEIRTLKSITEYNLPIDKKTYVQKANSYVLFYQVVKKCRVWSKEGCAPYMLKHIYEQMPTDFSLDYSNPPQELLDLIEKNCI